MITPSHNDLRPDLDAIEAAAFPPDGDAPASPPSPDDVRALIDYIRHLEAQGGSPGSGFPSEWWCANCNGFRPARYQLADLVCGCGHIIATVQFSPEAPEPPEEGSAPVPTAPNALAAFRIAFADYAAGHLSPVSLIDAANAAQAEHPAYVAACMQKFKMSKSAGPVAPSGEGRP